MTEKETASKKTAAKKATTKKAAAKKAAPKKEVKKPVVKASKTTAKVKEPVDTAPYLSNKKASNDTDNSNYIIPAVLILVLSIVIVSTFYADQVNSLVAKLSFGTEAQETIAESTDTETAIEAELTTQTSDTASETTISTEAASSSLPEAVANASPDTDKADPVTTENTDTTAATNSAKDLPSMAPGPYDARPSWAIANKPYNMGATESKSRKEMLAKQKEAYDLAMQQQREMMIQANQIRKSAYERMQKERHEMQLKMEEIRQQSMKIQYEMNQKMKEVYNEYHAI